MIGRPPGVAQERTPCPLQRLRLDRTSRQTGIGRMPRPFGLRGVNGHRTSSGATKPLALGGWPSSPGLTMVVGTSLGDARRDPVRPWCSRCPPTERPSPYVRPNTAFLEVGRGAARPGPGPARPTPTSTTAASCSPRSSTCSPGRGKEYTTRGHELPTACVGGECPAPPPPASARAGSTAGVRRRIDALPRRSSAACAAGSGTLGSRTDGADGHRRDGRGGGTLPRDRAGLPVTRDRRSPSSLAG